MPIQVGSVTLDLKGWLALALFIFQNGCAALIMRYSKVMGLAPYDSSVAVLLQEVAVKLPICMVLYAVECGGPVSAVRSVANDMRERTSEWVMLAVPALLYTVQNNMLYVGFANLEAAIGLVTYQSKIFFTGTFSLLLLGKKVSAQQWCAMALLAAGVVCAQGNFGAGASPPPPPASRHHGGGGGAHRHHGRALADAPEQSPALGFAAFIVAAVCTSFASVFFEKMLKGASKPSLWLRNIQLATYSTVIACVGLVGQRGVAAALSPSTLLAGFDQPIVWLSVLWQSAGGILVAVTIKYADNILRGFAQGVAIIVGAVGSHYIFGFELSAVFIVGVGAVLVAVFLYGGPPDLCPSLCGWCCAPVVAPADDGDGLSGGESLLENMSAVATDDDDDSPNSPSPDRGGRR